MFAAKANRTKMEETPVEIAPDTETKEDFIIIQDVDDVKSSKKNTKANKKNEGKGQSNNTVKPQPQQEEEDVDEFDLSDISAKPAASSREDIIAAAEEAAFAELEQSE